MEKKFLTRNEAAELLGVNPQTISNMVERGILIKDKKLSTKNLIIYSKELFDLLKPEAIDYDKSLEELKRLQEEVELKKQEQKDFLKSINPTEVSRLMSFFRYKANEIILTSEEGSQKLWKFDLLRDYLRGMSGKDLEEKYWLSMSRIQILVRELTELVWEAYSRPKDPASPLDPSSFPEKRDIKSPDFLKKYKLLQKDLRDCRLSKRCINCLRNNDINYLFDLVQHTEIQLLSTINSFGKTSVNEITEFLNSIGLSLGMDISEYKEYHNRLKTN